MSLLIVNDNAVLLKIDFLRNFKNITVQLYI